MIKRLIFILVMTGPFFGMAQSSFTLNGQIRNLPGRTVYLLSYYGEKNFLVDSAMTDSEGRFAIALKPSLKPGLFKVAWGKDNSFDLVYNKENIKIATWADTPVDSMQVISSLENRIYYDVLMMDQVGQAELDLIQPIVDYYPVRNNYYQVSALEYEGIQRGEAAILDSLVKLFPGSVAVRIFGVMQPPFLAADLGSEGRMNYLRAHYFDHVNFNDTALLRTNAFSNKAISYLSLYSNNRLSQKQLEAEFIKAVTVIMSAATVNPETYKFLLDYLVGGFDKYHFEEVIAYMAENFQDPFSCEDQDKKSALQKKLDTFKQIAIGKTAPVLEAPDTKGNIVKLSDINSEYTLLIFYSSECSHCADMIPKVKQLYDAQKPKRMEVVAYSLDTDKTAWQQFIKTR